MPKSPSYRPFLVFLYVALAAYVAVELFKATETERMIGRLNAAARAERSASPFPGSDGPRKIRHE